VKALFTGLIVLLVAVAAAMVVREDPGYVMITIKDWTIESSLVVFVIGAILLFSLLYYVVRMLGVTRSAPRRLSHWRQHRRERGAMKDLSLGYAELASCHWREAEAAFVRSAKNNAMPYLSYLFAARAALKQGEQARCSGYLNKARQVMGQGDIAVGITEVESFLESGNGEMAAEVLRWLRARAPKDKGVLLLARKVYSSLEQWDKLARLIPHLRSNGLVTLSEKEDLEGQAYRGLFASAVDANDGQALLDAWKKAPNTVSKRADIVELYVKGLLGLGYGDNAEAAIFQFFKRGWSDKLVYMYGMLESADAIRQLHRAETWLKKQPHNPLLLLTLGRLCIRNEQWKRARQYLEESIALHPYTETCRVLGDLLEHHGEAEAALDCYRQGILLLGDDGATPAQPRVSKPALPAASATPGLLSAQS